MRPQGVALTDDVFLSTKIEGAAALANWRMQFVKDADQLFEASMKNKPCAFIIDLGIDRPDPFELISSIKSDSRLGAIPILAFFSHVEIALKNKAKEVGCDEVFPKSVFFKVLPELLRRYASQANARRLEASTKT